MKQRVAVMERRWTQNLEMPSAKQADSDISSAGKLGSSNLHHGVFTCRNIPRMNGQT